MPPAIRLAFAAALGLVVAVGLFVAVLLAVDRPETFDDITEHFKYGSIGSEPGVSLLQPVGGNLVPYWIFRALPSICPEKLPGGYAAFGFVVEPGHELPVGISRRHRIGLDHVGMNCATCHSGTVRDTPGSTPRLILGMPAHQLDLHSFVQSVMDCSLDPRLTPEAVRATLPDTNGPSVFERLLLRVGFIDTLKVLTRESHRRLAPLLDGRVPAWGRGRVDTFSPYKALQFNWDLSALPGEELIGAADFPSLWNQAPREGMHLHWDGDNDSVDERNLSAGLGAGITPVTVDHAGLQRVRDWIWTLPPPVYPYELDSVLAVRGEMAYRGQCRACHGDHRFRDGVKVGSRLGLVEDIEVVGTDRHRLDSFTWLFATNLSSLYPASPYRFTRFRKTHGYANQPLDGLWLRGPYLHNGSVPTLRDLLRPPAERPRVFFRGYDVFDPINVGFVSDVPAADGRVFFRYDVSVPGNDNGGHEFGTTLPDEDKRAIVEYLKTF